MLSSAERQVPGAPAPQIAMPSLRVSAPYDLARGDVQTSFGHRVQRERILEMGNLVGSNPGHGALLYTLVGAAMYEAGVDYLLFTANRAVRVSLMRSGFASVPIASADRSRLGAASEDWGSYYNGQPQVMLGDVRAAMKACMAKTAVRNILSEYHDSINELVEIIQTQLR